MSDVYTKVGNVSIEKLVLTNFDGSVNYDLSSDMMMVSITESMFENVIYGSMLISDSIGLEQNLPIIGQETLSITWTTGTKFKRRSMDFRVYKVGDHEETGNNRYAFNLYFVSQELITSETLKISRSFRSKTVDRIVSSLYSDLQSEKPIEVDKAITNQTFVVANKTPLQGINSLTNHAFSEDYNGSLFFFYETTEGFKFKTIESLYRQSELFEYSMIPSNVQADSQKDFYSIVDMKFKSKFNTLEAVSRGMYQNSCIGFDPIAKSFRTFDYDYVRDFSKTEHIESGMKLTSGDFQGSTSPQRKLVITRGLSMRSDEPAYTKENVIPFRMSQFVQMKYIDLMISINGNTSIFAGCVLKISLPPMAYDDQKKDETNSRYLSGRYIVNTINHVMTNTSYTMGLSLSRDVFSKEPSQRIS